MKRLNIFLFFLFAAFSGDAQEMKEISKNYYNSVLAVDQYAKDKKISKSYKTSGGVTYNIRYIAINQPIYDKTHNVGSAKTIGTDKLQIGGSLGLGLTGEGVKAAIWDGGRVRLSHQELVNRTTQSDAVGADFDLHATHVSGTMIASGINSFAKGMSTKASLFVFDFNNDVAEMGFISRPDDSGLLISNHSYGTVAGWNFENGKWVWFGDAVINTSIDYKFGFYDNTASLWDNIAFASPYYTIVKSAGNDRNDVGDGSKNSDGPFDCISTFGNAKNIITVGSILKFNNYTSPQDVQISSFSSWGPTDDGRIKPDLVAVGENLLSSAAASDQAYATLSGTSMSSPSISGSLILLQQLYHKLHGSYLKSSTLKAIAIHTAREAGASLGPDYSYGWGLFAADLSAKLILDEDNLNTIVKVEKLAPNQTYSIDLNPRPNEKIMATLCWTDPAGVPTSIMLTPTKKMLVNDLDIRIVDSAGSTGYPWMLDPTKPSNAALKEDNARDNIERLEFDSPQQRKYSILVSHKGVLKDNLAQEFALVITYKSFEDSKVSRYWVGGSGNWEDASHWSDVSGGISSNFIPDQNTRVVFDENSFPSPTNNIVSLNSDHLCYSVFWFSKAQSSFELNGNELTISENLLFDNNSVSMSSSGSFNLINTDSLNCSLKFGGNVFPSLTIRLNNSKSQFSFSGLVTLDSLILVNGQFDCKQSSIKLNVLKSVNGGRIDLIKSIFHSGERLQVILKNTILNSSETSFNFNTGLSEIDSDVSKFTTQIYLTNSNLKIRGRSDFRYISGVGSLTLLDSHKIDTLKLNGGSILSLEGGKSQYINSQIELNSTGTNSIKLLSTNSIQAKLVVVPYSKICFDNLRVSNVNVEGEAVVSAGLNSVLINSLNWIQQECSSILFPDFKYKYNCRSSYLFLEDNSTGTISDRTWNFNDGTSSKGLSPIKNLANSTSLSVSLMISNGVFTKSVSKSISVLDNSLPENSIVTDGDLLISFRTSPFYKWFVNDAMIENETKRSITLNTMQGSYRVLTFDNTCNRVSSPYLVTETEDAGKQQEEVSPFPNPFEDFIKINNLISTKVFIFDASGSPLFLGNFVNLDKDSQAIDTSSLATGFYILKTENKGVIKYFRMVKR